MHKAEIPISWDTSQKIENMSKNDVYEQLLHAPLLSVEVKKCVLCAMKRGKDEHSFQTISHQSGGIV